MPRTSPKIDLSDIADHLAVSILSLDATTEYGTEGRETMGGTMMANIARSLVAIHKEVRETEKMKGAQSEEKVVKIQAAPQIPTPKPVKRVK